jgi:hypothetical protein
MNYSQLKATRVGTTFERWGRTEHSRTAVLGTQQSPSRSVIYLPSYFSLHVKTRYARASVTLFTLTILFRFESSGMWCCVAGRVVPSVD